jgi:hypothetical protein
VATGPIEEKEAMVVGSRSPRWGVPAFWEAPTEMTFLAEAGEPTEKRPSRPELPAATSTTKSRCLSMKTSASRAVGV